MGSDPAGYLGGGLGIGNGTDIGGTLSLMAEKRVGSLGAGSIFAKYSW
jgi:hypothetical protein